MSTGQHGFDCTVAMGGGNVLWHIEVASDWSGSSAWRPDVGIDKSVITDPPTNPDGSYK